MICEYFDHHTCLLTGYECVLPPKGYLTCVYYQREKDKACLRGDQWSAAEIKKALDHWSERTVWAPRETFRSVGTCTAADPVYKWNGEPPSATEIKLRAEAARKIVRDCFDLSTWVYKEKKMETMYEYKMERASTSLTPASLANFNPCEKEFGRYSLWYFTNNRRAFSTSENLAAIVEKGETVWLDWLVEKGLVERTEVKRELTIEDMQLSTCSEGVMLRVGTKAVLVFEPSGRVRRIGSAKNPFIPTDEEGKIIID